MVRRKLIARNLEKKVHASESVTWDDRDPRLYPIAKCIKETSSGRSVGHIVIIIMGNLDNPSHSPLKRS